MKFVAILTVAKSRFDCIVLLIKFAVVECENEEFRIFYLGMKLLYFI